MGRMGREYGGFVRRMIVWRAIHGVPVAIEWIETGVAVPRLVEMQSVDALTQQFLDARGAVTKAVVGRIGYDRVDRLRIDTAGDERIVLDALLDGLRGQSVLWNRPDQAEAVPGRHQVSRNRSRHDHRMLDRLVAVAVAQRDLVA